MKRFWKVANIVEREDGFAVELDGRPIRTPDRNRLIVPTAALAQAIAAEWDVQGEKVDLKAMPLTRLAQGAIDQVAANRDYVIDRIATYARSDTLYYRADDRQPELAAEQARQWDSLLDWARGRYDIGFETVAGVVHRDQPEATVERLREVVVAQDDFALAAMLQLAGLVDSLILVLALVEGERDAETLWLLGHLEELWQEQQWGEDAEALARREVRLAEWRTGVQFLTLGRS